MLARMGAELWVTSVGVRGLAHLLLDQTPCLQVQTDTKEAPRVASE